MLIVRNVRVFAAGFVVELWLCRVRVYGTKSSFTFVTFKEVLTAYDGAIKAQSATDIFDLSSDILHTDAVIDNTGETRRACRHTCIVV